MTQVSKYTLRKDVSDRIFELFAKILTSMPNKERAEVFISEFFTPTEKIMLSKRVAIMFLLEKRCDYNTIKDILKVSSSTIATVNTLRQYRSKGYRKLISKILKDEKMNTFFGLILDKLLEIPASSREGSGSWKYITRKSKKSHEKPF